MVKKYCLCLLLQLVVAVVSSKHHGNPANDIANFINKNRTSGKLAPLNDSPGLGCMALQYIEQCKGNCSDGHAGNCKPPEDDFTEVFAPNCGVELPTLGTITGHIVGCEAKNVEPAVAFKNVIVRDNKKMGLLRNKSHSEVGVGLVRGHKGFFFWCVLFGNGAINSTFVLEDHGTGIKQKMGCFSGSPYPCNAAAAAGIMFVEGKKWLGLCLHFWKDAMVWSLFSSKNDESADFCIVVRPIGPEMGRMDRRRS